MKHPLKTAAVLALATMTGACTIKNTEPPPLSGPSELALSLAITANPDVLSLDGSSQSQVRVLARDENGQPKPNVLLRGEIIVNGVAVEYGSLSARTRSTDGSGVAVFTYTAPAMVGNDVSIVQLSITPEGAGYEDAASHIRRLVTIRLVPPGVIGVAPTAAFTFTPEDPAAFTDVRFDASESSGGIGATITGYSWDFGDNSSGTGVSPTHRYSAQGTYQAKLTVTNSNGLSSSITKSIAVGAGSAPTADFIFNPSNPTVGTTVFFTGTTSTPGAGHQIVRYQWNFGDGTTKSGSTTSKAYAASGVYNVLLTVTDEVGQTAQAVKAVTVGASTATASFTISPTNPTVGTPITFNGGASTGEGTNSVVKYEWNFGCVAGTNCTTATATTTGPTTTTTYTAAFTYTVTLTITDSKGKKATTTVDVTVAP